MTDFATGRHKKLDLVIARPPQVASIAARSFKGLAARYGIELTDLERGVLEALPDIYVGEVGAVLIAQEAKACRTAHIKALPRLYDEAELVPSLRARGISGALAIGYAQVNSSDSFVRVVGSEQLRLGRPSRELHRAPPTRRHRAGRSDGPRPAAASYGGDTKAELAFRRELHRPGVSLPRPAHRGAMKTSIQLSAAGSDQSIEVHQEERKDDDPGPATPTPAWVAIRRPEITGMRHPHPIDRGQPQEDQGDVEDHRSRSDTEFCRTAQDSELRASRVTRMAPRCSAIRLDPIPVPVSPQESPGDLGIDIGDDRYRHLDDRCSLGL